MSSNRTPGSRVLDGDLVWYWDERRGDLGVRGVALEPTVRGDRELGPTEAQLAASARARRLEAALWALDAADQLLLRQAHAPVAPAVRCALSWAGDLAGVAWADPELRVSRRPSDVAALRARYAASVAGAVSRFRAALDAHDQARAAQRSARREARARALLDGGES